MYQFSYAEVVDHSPAVSRASEHAAINNSIELLKAAEANGRESREAVQALWFTQRLWGILIEDLAKPENELPSRLRADLISIGLWVFREIEGIRLGNIKNFNALIAVSMSIAEGLK